jgi:hypothetical protein
MTGVQIHEFRADTRFIGRATGTPHMTPRELEEYKALRATIRERGTVRHWTAAAGFSVWALLATIDAAYLDVPVTVLLPLLVLVATFEIVLALHTGVERVGRYLQVFYEAPDEDRRWEHVAMSYGSTFGGGGIDALFSPLFWAATVFNLIPALMSGPVAIDWAVVGLVHALFVVRVLVAKRQAAHQRSIDLQRFGQIKEKLRSQK